MSIRRGDSLEDIETPAEILEPHRKRKLSAFLVAPDPGNHSDSKVFDAFWDLIFDGHPNVEHEIACAVDEELAYSELVKTELTVGSVLDGWRPSALGVKS